MFLFEVGLTLLQSNEGKSHGSFKLIVPAFEGSACTAGQTFSGLFKYSQSMAKLRAAGE